MPPKRPLTLALLACCVPLAALASVVKAETLGEMVAQSPLIVHGRVHQVQVVSDDQAGQTFTYAEVEVLEALKGQPAPRFLVRQTGGTVGGRTLYVEGAPRFVEGAESIFFLEQAPDDPSLYLVHAMAAGKFDIELNKVGQARVTRHLQGLAFARPSPQPKIMRVGADEDDGTPQDFIAKVKALVKGGAR